MKTMATPEAHSVWTYVQTHQGRCEHRMDVAMTGRLEEICADPICDRVTIRNISSHGARVISERPWRTREHVHLAEPGGDEHLEAEVIYCEPLDDSQFAVGLRFESTARRRG